MHTIHSFIHSHFPGEIHLSDAQAVYIQTHSTFHTFAHTHTQPIQHPYYTLLYQRVLSQHEDKNNKVCYNSSIIS